MFSLLVLTIILVHARADYGPYQQSAEYDDGAFGEWPTECYRSNPVIGPSLNLLQDSQLCLDGQYTFLAPAGQAVDTPGPMLIDQDGHLVWTKQYGPTSTVGVYSFQGTTHLTFCVGKDYVAGYGDADTCYMLDSSYDEAYRIRGTNDLAVDRREFHVTRDDTAIITVSDPVSADLHSVDGPENGWILDGTFQEVDIWTGELQFQWQASQHFDFTESYSAVDPTGSEENPWDFFRITSVDKDAKGNFLVASDSMNCLAYVSGQTGEVLWKLGGKNSTFEHILSDDAATLFSGPSHARFADNENETDGTAITLFDRARDAPDPTSRGLYLLLDQGNKTARVKTQYRRTREITTPRSGGSTQLLDSGNVLVSYGAAAAWAEYTSDGTPLCEVHFGPESNFNDGSIGTDRITRHAWTGLPKTNPDLQVVGYSAAMSWNGATEVATWVLEGSDSFPVTTDDDGNSASDDSDSDTKFALIAAERKSGFETILPIPPSNTYPILRARALDTNGKPLGVSKPLAWNPTPEEAAEVGAGRPTGWLIFAYFLTGFLSAAAVGGCVWAVRRWRMRPTVRLKVGPVVEVYEGRSTGWRAIDDEFNGDQSLSGDEVGLLEEEEDMRTED